MERRTSRDKVDEAPLGPQKNRMAADRVLLVERVAAQLPKLARNRCRSGSAAPRREPVDPVRVSKACLIEVVFEIAVANALAIVEAFPWAAQVALN